MRTSNVRGATGRRAGKLAALALMVSAGLSAGAVAAAPPAEAAGATCNSGYLYAGGFDHYTKPNYNGSISCYLNGSANVNATATRALQSDLNKCYGESLAVDGIYGWRTAAAVKRAQLREHVTADGLYGPQTAGAMMAPLYWTTNQGTKYLGCR